MAAERKENSVLFTLKELKDITADQPDPPPATAAPAKPKRAAGSFIDDAESLLADIRDSVDEEAAAEARRLEDEKRAAEEAERRRLEDEESRHRAEMEARVAAEEARRRAAADERAAKAAAIDRAERIARGEIVDEPEPERPQVIQAAPQAPPSRGTGFYLIVVGLPVLCLTAVAIALIMRPVEQATIGADAINTAAVTPVAPPPTPAVAVEEPEEEDLGVPDAAPPDAAPKKVATKKRRRTRKAKTDTPTGESGDSKSGKKKLNIKLGGEGGGITF